MDRRTLLQSIGAALAGAGLPVVPNVVEANDDHNIIGLCIKVHPEYEIDDQDCERVKLLTKESLKGTRWENLPVWLHSCADVTVVQAPKEGAAVLTADEVRQIIRDEIQAMFAPSFMVHGYVNEKGILIESNESKVARGHIARKA